MAAYDHLWYFPSAKEDSLSLKKVRPQSPSLVSYETLDEKDRLRKGDYFDWRSLLFSQERDYLISNDGIQVHAHSLESKIIVAVAFYIPAFPGDGVATTCEDIIDTYNELMKEGKSDLQVVLVLRMRPDFPGYNDMHVSDTAFQHFLSAFPKSFLAVPISDSDCCTKLFRLMGMNNYYAATCIITDKHGKVLQVNLGVFMRFGAYLYPFTDERLQELWTEEDRIKEGGMPLETLLGCQKSSSQVLECYCGCGKLISLSHLKHKVVALYLLRDGSDLQKIHQVYLQCKERFPDEFVIVVTYQPHSELNHPLLRQRRLSDLLRLNNVSCGWFELSSSDKISRRLWHLCDLPPGDKLIVLNRDTYPDPDALEAILQFGVDAYPFTKDAVAQKVVARMRGCNFPDLLTCNGVQYVHHNGRSVPLSYFQGRDVLLCFENASNPECWEDELLMWYRDLRETNPDFHVIFVCLDKKLVGDRFDRFCSKRPWLPAVPYGKPAKAVAETVIDKFGYIPRVIAYGSDGQFRRLDPHLGTFPSSSDDMVEALKVRFKFCGPGYLFEGLKI